ncbi:Nucleoid occlusion factor SlmA [Curvibacter sp. AEP1-3]|uniref:nucleoid occlusion factor SlmA n=1 Tax=Curvibacter sp. AEP1-3 TaxID=1844971 RepID=UPI000B3C03BC|nr:nucleoid occlusion factor SlmA [Curvibacter sp. AEP1-3]ARV20045.1 Nucleoid occlusion factor SlmA [Curvibacter sp. AEP1-3]
MSDSTAAPTDAPDTSAQPDDAAPARKRPKPGERRVQILQMLATMLEQPGGERITTAALAARLEVSEAALYRHFASKAQMFEGLIDFIEQTVFSLINQIVEKEAADAGPATGTRQASRIAGMLVQFAEKNPGMTRVMVGDALVLEHERLQQRMNALFDKVESTIKQCLRDAALNAPASGPRPDPQVQAAAVVALVAGRLQRYTRSGFKRSPSEHLEPALALILG